MALGGITAQQKSQRLTRSTFASPSTWKNYRYTLLRFTQACRSCKGLIHSTQNTLVAAVIDSEGYRLNVGIILCNAEGRLFWAKRIGQAAWQFPQGGIRRNESPQQAMFRELAEEVGLRPEHVQVLGATRGWLRYRLPRHLIREKCQRACIGQKQIWFLLRMRCADEAVHLDHSERPEFDHWQWVDYWYPLRAVVPFKRQVYYRALHELAPLLSRSNASSSSTLVAQNATANSQPVDAPAPHLTILHVQSFQAGSNPVITQMTVTRCVARIAAQSSEG